jgi:membrane-bound lytic murein transglycosylase
LELNVRSVDITAVHMGKFEWRVCAQSRQLTMTRKTVEKHVLHWHQLYEQQKQKKATAEEMAFILDRYVNRWQRWAAAGLQGIKIGVYEQNLNQQALIQIAR